MKDLILWKTSYHKKVLCLLQGMMINLMKKNLIGMQVPKIIKWLGTQVPDKPVIGLQVPSKLKIWLQVPKIWEEECKYLANY